MSNLINLHKLNIEGFASIPELKYKFSREGLSTLVGENGSGKTSIINALSWCIYGKLIKKDSTIVPWEWTKSPEFNGTKVKIELERGGRKVEIIRCYEYGGNVKGARGNNRLILVEDGAVSPLRDKSDIQKAINAIMGGSFELFKNSVVFGQSMKRLMEEDGPTKKKVLEEAFQVSFISEAKDRVEKKILDLDKQTTLQHLKLNSAQEKKETLLKNLKTAKKLSQGENKNWADTISKWNIQLKDLTKELENIPSTEGKKKLISKLNSHVEKLSKQREELSNREFKLNLLMNSLGHGVSSLKLKIEEQKERFKTAEKNCNTCGQKIPRDKIVTFREELQGFITELKVKLEKSQEEYNGIKKEYDEVNNNLASIDERVNKEVSEKKAKIKKLEDKIGIINGKKVGILSKIKLIKDELAILLANPPKLTHEVIKDIRKELKEAKVEVVKEKGIYLNLRDELDINRWLTKDPLSNSGLKAYIFNASLGKVNKQLRKYEKLIGFRMELCINLKGHNKDLVGRVFKDKEEVSFNDLSGGQKQLSNVALLFAIDDVLNKYNCLILDEVFESISRGNLEIVEQMILHKARTKSIHIITHQSGFNPVNSYQRILELNNKGQTVVTSKLAQN